jgi:signal transduction histidine kinase
MAEPADPTSVTPALHLDELLGQLRDQLAKVIGARDRLHGLLEAVVAVGGDLELEPLLGRIVDAATRLVDARYGALGVVGPDRRLGQFITVGVDAGQRARIGDLPSGRGILGELIRHPESLRLSDLSAHPSSVGFPPNHPPMRTFLGVPLTVRGEVFGNLYLTDKRDGSDFDEDDQALVEAMAASAAVAIENARLLADSRRRAAWSTGSTEVTQALLSGDDPSDVLDLIARRARELVRADLATIALRYSDDELVIEVADGPEAPLVRGRRLPVDRSLAGEALRKGVALRVADASSDDRAAGPVPGQHAYGPSLVVPLGSRDEAVGVLMVSNAGGGPTFTDEVEEVLTSFAGQAAVALELARQRRDAERAALYGDRDRIARDLHDLVIQRLFATGMRLDSVAARIEDEQARHRVLAAVEDLDATIREIRTTIYSLQNVGRGLEPDLRTRVLEVVEEARGGRDPMPAVVFEGPVESTVPPAVVEHLLAVVREAVSNAARHAHASAVTVTLAVGDGWLRLTVDDDGVGLPAEVRRSGLANIEDRALLLGGTATVASPGGAGTQLAWQVPL